MISFYSKLGDLERVRPFTTKKPQDLSIFMQAIYIIMKQVQNFDRDPAYPPVSVGGKTQKTNLCGGVLGVIFWLILLVLLIKKGIGVFGKSQVNVQSFIQKDQEEIKIDSKQFVFTLYICQQRDQKCQAISPLQQKSFGFQTIMVQYFLWYDFMDQKVHNDVQLRPMIPCQDDEDLYCVPSDFDILKIQCQIQRVGPFGGCNQTRFYDILIRQCQKTDPNCASEIAPDIHSQIFFKNNRFNIFKTKTQQVITQISQSLSMFGTIFTQQNQYVMEVFFSKLKIETDQSIFPSIIDWSQPNKNQSWFYSGDYDVFIDYYPYAHHRYLTYQLRRSPITQVYRRSFQKFDTMLAQILGFLGLFSWIVTIFCAGYNQYLMENHVVQKSDQVSKISQYQGQNQQTKDEQKPSYWNYLKGKIKNARNICKPQTGRNQYHQIDILNLQKKVYELQQKFIELKSQRSMPEPPKVAPNRTIVKNLNQKQQDLKQSLLTEHKLEPNTEKMRVQSSSQNKRE